MQAVILAAGNSTRTYPLTLTRPKPLLKVANKTILEYNLGAIRHIADEIIIVVGYKQEMIREFVNKNCPNLNIRFVEQIGQRGTGHAVSILEGIINGSFILLMGDNIYSKKDVDEISKHKNAILVKKVKNPELFGVVIEKNKILVDIVEKPKKFVSDLISCALYIFDKEIFNALKGIKKSERGEYELTDAIKGLSGHSPIYCVESSSCFQIGYPWDLLISDQQIRQNKNIIGKNSKISGKIKNSAIGDNCLIDGNVSHSIIMDNVTIGKGSLIEHSVIGENVYFNGKAKSAKNAESIVKGKIIAAENLGAIIGDNVKAENVEIKPGCKIWPNKKISGIINHDIE